MKTEIQPRDLQWGEWLNYHGPLPLPYLVEAVQERFPTTLDAAKTRFKITSRAGIFDRPGKRLHGRAITQFYIYSNGEPMDEMLLNLGRITRPSMSLSQWNFHHETFLAHVTASLELGARKHDIIFIREHEVLKGAERGMPTEIRDTVTLHDGIHVGGRKEIRASHKKLFPDHYFRVNDDGKFCTFFVEVDRGNEQIRSADIDKKNWRATLMKYVDVIENKRHEKHLNMRGTIRVLLFFNKRSKLDAVKNELLDITGGKGKNYICFRLVPEFLDPFYIPRVVDYSLFEEGFERVGIDSKTKLAYQPFFLC